MHLDLLMWHSAWENLSLGFVNKKDADQPALRTVWSAPFLFAYQKVSHLDLLQANIQLSS